MHKVTGRGRAPSAEPDRRSGQPSIAGVSSPKPPSLTASLRSLPYAYVGPGQKGHPRTRRRPAAANSEASEDNCREGGGNRLLHTLDMSEVANSPLSRKS
jgi:hypothetical protein